MKYVAIPSAIIFLSSSSTGELSALSQSEARFVKWGEYSQNMLSEAFQWTPNISSSQFEEYAQLYSRCPVRPVKNQLYSPNTPKYVREQMFTQLRTGLMCEQRPSLQWPLSLLVRAHGGRPGERSSASQQPWAWQQVPHGCQPAVSPGLCFPTPPPPPPIPTHVLSTHPPLYSAPLFVSPSLSPPPPPPPHSLCTAVSICQFIYVDVNMNKSSKCMSIKQAKPFALPFLSLSFLSLPLSLRSPPPPPPPNSSLCAQRFWFELISFTFM